MYDKFFATVRRDPPREDSEVFGIPYILAVHNPYRASENPCISLSNGSPNDASKKECQHQAAETSGCAELSAKGHSSADKGFRDGYIGVK